MILLMNCQPICWVVWLIFLVFGVEIIQGQNTQQAEQRVVDTIGVYVNRPVNVLSVWNDFYTVGGFPNGMSAQDRDAVSKYLFSFKLNTDEFHPYYGLESGLFAGYIPFENSSVPSLQYREPGQGGYDPDTSSMAIHWETCVNSGSGVEEQCAMTAGDTYVVCVNNCEYIKCNDVDSQTDCSKANDHDACEDNTTWCRHYTFEEATGDIELGYIPASEFCINSTGSNSEAQGEILVDGDDETIELGDCTFGSGALVNRDISGPYAYCGGSGEVCNTTFVGARVSYSFDPRVRGWYIDAKDFQQPRFSDAYPFLGSDTIGITATHPITNVDEEGRNLFYGVLAADLLLDEISVFLEEEFQTKTNFTVAVYEAGAPHYMIAVSTGSAITLDFPIEDVPTNASDFCRQPCSDEAQDDDIECAVDRVIIDCLNRTGENNDTVLVNAHSALRGCNQDPDGDFVTVKGNDPNVHATSYLSTCIRYNQSEANLNWEVIVTSPLGRDPGDAIIKGDASYIFIWVLSILGFAVNFGLFVWFVSHRNERAVMLSDYKFTSLFVLMCAFLNLASLGNLGERTDASCMRSMWVFNVLIALALSPLFVKTYRTWKLLGASPSSADRAKMSNFRAWIWTFPIPLAEVFILTMTTIFDPPLVVEDIEYIGRSPVQSLSCDHNSYAVAIIDTLFFLFLIIIGCVLAFLTRRIDPRFADAKALIFVMYNIASVAILVFAILTLVEISPDASISNTVTYTIQAVAVFWVSVFSAGVFVIPRVTKAKRDHLKEQQELSRRRLADARAVTKRSFRVVSRASEQVHQSRDSLKIFIGSANIGNAKPTLQSMRAWIPEGGLCDNVTTLDGNPVDAERFDVVVIGMQESTWSSNPKKSKNKTIDETVKTATDDKGPESPNDDASNESLRIDEEQIYLAALEGEDTFALREMEKKILGEGYTLVKEEVRGQMRLYIWSLSGLAPFLDDIRVSGANTGIGNVLANKGGIIISFEYHRTRFTFLSAHLAAHEGESYYKARCENIRDILRSSKTFDLSQKFDLTLSSHHMFVLGDLNFRTKFEEKAEHEENVERALELIRTNDFQTLYKYDELHKGIVEGDLLLGFQTLPCHFHPTFKVQRESGFVYNEQRTPSYTDRIVFKSSVGMNHCLRPLSYEPCIGFVTSDHKPIRGAFSVVTNEMVDPIDLGCRFLMTFSEMECFDLPAADINGRSDPFLMFLWDGIDMQEELAHRFGFRRCFSDDPWPRTKYVSKDLNPKWNQSINIASTGHEVASEAVLYVSAWDYDFGSKNQLLGTLPLNILELVTMDEGQSRKEVYIDRLLQANGKQAGRIKFKLEISSIIG